MDRKTTEDLQHCIGIGIANYTKQVDAQAM
jgi:hypothetical protein